MPLTQIAKIVGMSRQTVFKIHNGAQLEALHSLYDASFREASLFLIALVYADIFNHRYLQTMLYS